jgi:hypothetical protein
VRTLPLARAARAPWYVAAALVAFAFGMLTSGITVLYGMATIIDRSSYSAFHRVRDTLPIEYSMSTLTFGVALVFVNAALGRIGDALRETTVARRVRWVTSLVLVGAAAVTAFFASLMHLEARHGTEGSGFIAGLFFLWALGAIIAVVVQLVRALGATRRAVDAAVAAANPS